MTGNGTARGCSVFVGNVDFEIDEATIRRELSAAGTVVNFRMMYDKSTGKSKGYGFCEYETPEMAEYARNNLNIVFNGRPVKINYAENDMPVKTKDEAENTKVLSIDLILRVIDEMIDTESISEILQYFKKMAINDPSDLNMLLRNNPNLCCGLMYLLIKSKIVDEKQVLDIFRDSFDVDILEKQIETRIDEMSVKGLPIETINRLEKLKMLVKKQQNEE